MTTRMELAPTPAGRKPAATPRRWRRLVAEQPGVARGYEALRAACDAAGPLEPGVIALVKLAVSVGARDGRTTHIHTKKALAAGVAPEALRQVAFVAMPTIGLPAALDALDWIDESLLEARAADPL